MEWVPASNFQKKESIHLIAILLLIGQMNPELTIRKNWRIMTSLERTRSLLPARKDKKVDKSVPVTRHQLRITYISWRHHATYSVFCRWPIPLHSRSLQPQNFNKSIIAPLLIVYCRCVLLKFGPFWWNRVFLLSTDFDWRLNQPTVNVNKC